MMEQPKPPSTEINAQNENKALLPSNQREDDNDDHNHDHDHDQHDVLLSSMYTLVHTKTTKLTAALREQKERVQSLEESNSALKQQHEEIVRALAEQTSNVGCLESERQEQEEALRDKS